MCEYRLAEFQQTFDTDAPIGQLWAALERFWETLEKLLDGSGMVAFLLCQLCILSDRILHAPCQGSRSISIVTRASRACTSIVIRA